MSCSELTHLEPESCLPDSQDRFEFFINHCYKNGKYLGRIERVEKLKYNRLKLYIRSDNGTIRKIIIQNEKK